MFTNTQVTTSRIIYTPSLFARTSLIHLQEVGTLQALKPHVSSRSDLQSYLFFIVRSGSGTLTCDGHAYTLEQGDCVFIDCHQPYSQCSGEDLWSLSWVHFYGPNLRAIHEKYRERGGQPAFHTKHYQEFITLYDAIYRIAESSSYIRDMELSEKLMALLTLLMDESWDPESREHKKKRKLDAGEVKSYLDEHFTEKIVLDDLAKRFFINKHYLLRLFKEQYGTTVNHYILGARITKAKGLLRFTDKTIETVGMECGFGDPNYFARAFKKVVGVSPGNYRKSW